MHEVTGFAVACGMHSLDNVQEMQEHASEVEQAKAEAVRGFKALGLRTHDTTTNFILVRFPEKLDTKTELMKQGILVRRPFTQSFLKGWTRVTVDGRNEVQRLLSATAVITGKERV